MTTTPEQPNKNRSYAIILIPLVLLIAFAVIFLAELMNVDTSTTGDDTTPVVEQYVEEVTALLENADPARGETLMVQQCNACHVIGAVNHIAPPFEGVADRAATRRPPMSAETYIYESIVYPEAYIVEGFMNSMPINYRDQYNDQDLGDIMAYLLTLHEP